MSAYSSQPITNWALEDRPREKLMQRGVDALTDAELLAILIGSGTRSLSAIDLARLVLDKFSGLDGLARCSVKNLTKVKGIGPAKAIGIVAAFELARRKQLIETRVNRISDSSSVAKYLSPRMVDLDHEIFYVLFLNRNNEIIHEQALFRGGVTATVIDCKIVFREAVLHLASSIIVAHNHPSGNLQPSEADRRITRQLSDAGELFEIRVLDHLIISHRGFYSFADEGEMR
ncbi:MAG: DNA repair protein RadC [Bacteroidia bacterium]|nr:DNA repair protein RadC [Bacteroidia bacterium]